MNISKDWRDGAGSMAKKVKYAMTNDNTQQDVVVVVGCGSTETRIKAHSFMLFIGSEVLQNLLQRANINSEEMKEIKLPDVQPEAMKFVLQYIYTDSFDVQHEDTMEILYASIKFNMHGLATLCVAKLKDEISSVNVLRIFKESVKMNIEELFQRSQEFILKNARAVFQQDQFMNIAKASLKKLLSFDELAMHEISIFEIVVRWGEAECVRQKNQKHLRSVLRDVVPLIRFTLMTINEFANFVVPTNILSRTKVIAIYTYLGMRTSPGNQPKPPSWILSSSKRTLEREKVSSTSSNISPISQAGNSGNLVKQMHPNINGTKDNLLQYLKNISGKQTISGLYVGNQEAIRGESFPTIHSIAGVYPGILTVSMPNYSDGIAVWQSFTENIISNWNNGYLIQITWWNFNHRFQQSHTQPSDDNYWNDLINDDGQSNREWKKQLDAYVPYLKQLQDAGVVVICDIVPWIKNQGFVSRLDPAINGSVKLYQLTHDYMTQKHRLHSLLWAWCFDFAINLTYLEEFWPGDNYVDVVSAFVWDRKVEMNVYYKILEFVGDKPISMEYMCNVPSPEDLVLQPRWTWFTNITTQGGALLDVAYEDNAGIQKIFESPLIINKENNEFFKHSKR